MPEWSVFLSVYGRGLSSFTARVFWGRTLAFYFWQILIVNGCFCFVVGIM